MTSLRTTGRQSMQPQWMVFALHEMRRGCRYASAKIGFRPLGPTKTAGFCTAIVAWTYIGNQCRIFVWRRYWVHTAHVTKKEKILDAIPKNLRMYLHTYGWTLTRNCRFHFTSHYGQVPSRLLTYSQYLLFWKPQWTTKNAKRLPDVLHTTLCIQTYVISSNQRMN
jgi:hypothetical protein